MSDYSFHIKSFIDTTLLPEIDNLNFRLSSYESFGYANKTASNLMLRLSKLVSIYDFLIEYADGDEECEWGVLRDLVTLSGLSVTSAEMIANAFNPWADAPNPVPPVEGDGASRALIALVYTVDGTDESTLGIQGNYLLVEGTSASWVPATAAVNDILIYASGGWSILHAMASKPAGGTEILFKATVGAPRDRVGAEYVWEGSEWEGFDAYEPEAGLLAIEVSNPNLGDISDPPYSMPAYTGDTLRGRSISSILDDMVFETIPYNYVYPELSITAATGNFERGASLTGDIISTFTKRDGGNLDNQSSTFVTPGADEHEITVTMGGVVNKIVSNTHAVGNRSVVFSIPGTANIRIPSTASTAVVGDIETISRTDDGVEQVDNKGGATPRPTEVLKRALSSRAYYYSRYPIWIGSTTEKFTVGNSELTDLTITPNGGQNNTATMLNSSWLQGAGVGMKSLVTSNLTNHVINVSAGDAHMLIICPPGITVSSIEISVLSSWQPVSNLADFNLTGILSLADDEPKTYKAYYLRDVANGTYSSDTSYRITTTGTIQP